MLHGKRSEGNRSREFRQEAIAVVQIGDNGLDKECGSRDRKTWRDSSQILETNYKNIL